MRTYELVLVVRASLSEAQQKKLVGSIKDLLKDVKITREEEWGKRSLGYPIKKEDSGIFMKWLLEAKESIPVDFEKKLLNTDDILRHLLIRRN